MSVGRALFLNLMIASGVITIFILVSLVHGDSGANEREQTLESLIETVNVDVNGEPVTCVVINTKGIDCDW